MNLQAYANHRKEKGLRGTSHVAVLKAIDRGRLMPPAVERVGRGWEINAELADAQWADATHPAERGTGHHTGREPAAKTVRQPLESGLPKGVPPRAHSEAVAAAVKAKRETILLQKEEEKLVYKEDFEAAQAAVLSNLMLGAASLSRQIRTDIPHLTQQECDKIQARIDDLFRAISDMSFEELDA
jgi:hypothetical protein